MPYFEATPCGKRCSVKFSLERRGRTLFLRDVSIQYISRPVGSTQRLLARQHGQGLSRGDATCYSPELSLSALPKGLGLRSKGDRIPVSLKLTSLSHKRSRFHNHVHDGDNVATSSRAQVPQPAYENDRYLPGLPLPYLRLMRRDDL